MRHLNYSHLQYFWAVANEGSVTRAAQQLHITPQTISGQLKLLDEAVGEPLFDRVGRGLVLTDSGRLVKQYADEIFALGGELAQVVRGRQSPARVLNVGIVNSIAKLIAYRVLQPALAAHPDLRLSCREGELEELLADLAVHRLDLLLSDQRVPGHASVRVYHHKLGESGIAFFAREGAARRYRKSFPDSLDGAPMLLPGRGSAIRRELDDWLDRSDVKPRIVAEFDDSALLKVFGAADAGVFPAPHAIAAEIRTMYGAQVIGLARDVRESYLAISPERKLKNATAMQIIESARENLFREV